MRRGVAAAALAIVAGAFAVAWIRPPAALAVAPGERVEDAAARAGRVVLLAGTHAGFTLTRATEVVAEPGAVVSGEVRVLGDGATLRGLTVRSSGNAVTVREVDGVVIEDLTVPFAGRHGVEVIDGSARISGCRVEPRGDYAQGIEVRNTNGRPRTIVERCVVRGGYEGIVAHVSRVEFRDNVVTGTAPRAIAITEMSEGIAERNLVHDAAGVAFWCGDYSHCEIRDNVVRGIRDTGIGARTEDGKAVLAFYYSTMRVRGMTIEGADAGEPVAALLGSALTDRFPPGLWPAGWRGAAPGIAAATAAGLGGAAALTAVAFLFFRRTRPAARPSRVLAPSIGAWLAAVAVQTFHMAEHGVQIFQVHVADAEHRAGLLGAHVNSEWLHLVWNALVFGFLVWTVALLRRLPGSRPVARAAAAAAIAIQSWHVAEHVAKVAQAAATGVSPAPGLLGSGAGLVWFHYAINLAVWSLVAFTAAELMRFAPRKNRIWRAKTAESGQSRSSALASPGAPG